ncbi:TM2 domain-containing protein [Streptococcus gallinaceus]|uniref:TM2 domain-containing membrane protein YozV n=1 Tax=Streptococcus gallinaceus TaxID=165758 RepID=A0ABV2JJC2_9STRE|nr:TM2 domain-containing protein [Streptococcus gallinaceus]MCP1639011.1 TM2 domain-containing membrane protein YozV [Streptococcus gallinaceus]MCP1769745.1 TM2 domain-containing membrane protein YozV [Streptococcus gallinaceus]
MNYAQIFLMNNMNAFPPEQIPMIQRELEQLDEQSLNALLMTDIKNPTVALILSIFVGEFGVDRFYAGQKELGIAKLALTVISFVTLFILIGFFLLIGVYIWKIVDWFLIMGATRQSNFERLMFNLNQVKAFQSKRKAEAATVVAEQEGVAKEAPVEEIIIDAPVVEETSESEEVQLDESDLVVPATGEEVEKPVEASEQ